MLKGIMKGVIVLILGIQLSGCALLLGAAAGAGGVVWAKGRLQEEINKPLDNLYKATLAGLKDMDLPITFDRKDDMSAKVESKFADGTNVWVDVEYVTDHSTRIVIRVGVLGDQTRSNKILEAIKQKL
ncbi:MAG: DUF3568 family protein [Candidatus Omnitrophota bacterium]